MTTEAHEHARSSTAVASPAAPRSRPRWLIPGLVIVVAGAGLVLAGVISASTAISAALISGMLLMHLGGHGSHGAHGGTASAGDAPADEADTPARSGGCH
ncbi:MAG: hypothetical protein ACLGIJ_13605 [Candidatus Limnocylindria bacterium]